MSSLVPMVEKALETGIPELFFVDSRGDLDSVALKDHSRAIETIVLELNEQAKTACGSAPCFEICTVIDGEVMTKDAEDLALDELPEALSDARAERVRFYLEREKEFGEDAWPAGTRPELN